MEEATERNIELVHPDVQKKICELLDANGITDYNLVVSEGSKKGDNYFGVIAKVTIDGKDKEGNAVGFDWIVKSAPQEDIYRTFMKVDHVFRREVLIYEKILSRFKQFENERGVENITFETPKYVMSCLEPYKESFVMQDMKTLGYAMQNRKKPLDLNHVRLVMKAYGKLHAISYAFRDQNPQEFKQIGEDTKENIYKDTVREVMAKSQASHNEKVISILETADNPKALNAYKKYAERAIDIVIDALLLAETDPLAVVGHGDCWTNNMLFKYGDPSRSDYPTKLCILDWQICRYGSLAFDLSYFLFTCTDKALRDKHYANLIKLYYYTLCGYLAELGSDPESLLSFEDLQAQLMRYSIFGLHVSTMVLQVILGEEEDAPEFKNFEDLQDLVETFNFESKNQAAYEERVKEVVVDYYEMGYFNFLF